MNLGQVFNSKEPPIMASQEESIINDSGAVSGRKEFDEDGSLLKSLEQRLSSPRGPEKEDHRLQSHS